MARFDQMKAQKGKYIRKRKKICKTYTDDLKLCSRSTKSVSRLVECMNISSGRCAGGLKFLYISARYSSHKRTSLVVFIVSQIHLYILTYCCGELVSTCSRLEHLLPQDETASQTWTGDIHIWHSTDIRQIKSSVCDT